MNNEVFVPTGGHANALNTPSARNRIKRWVATGLLELGLKVRKRLLSDAMINPSSLLADQDALERAVREMAAGVHHSMGTSCIGGVSDANAVAGPRCRVHGM